MAVRVETVPAAATGTLETLLQNLRESATRISSTDLWEEATVWPRVRPGSQAVSEHQETVGVSAVLVEVTPERCAQILPSVSDNLVGIAEGFQPENGSCSTSGLLWEAGSMLQEGADLTEGIATVAPSPVVLAAKISEDIVSGCG